MTIGDVAIAPKALVPLIAKRHFTFRLATFFELIGDRVVLRVFARS